MKKSLFISVLLIYTSGIFAQNVRSYVPTNGLLSWFPFTGNVLDSSGHGNNGVNFGATLTTDRFSNPNSAYSFNGSSNYISITDFVPQSAFSISLWFKTDSNLAQNYYYQGTGEINLGQYAYSPNIVFGGAVKLSNTIYYDTYDTSIIGNWIHLVVTYTQGDKVRTYVNGIVKDSTGILPNLGLYTGTASCSSIGAYDGGCSSQGYFFNGVLDDIGVWNRPLSPCEITQLYLATKVGIVSNPKNDTVISGGTAVYSIKDTGSATYQWQQNSGTGFTNLSNAGPYSGVKTKTLTINPVTMAMNNYLYRCIRNGSCPDTSTNAALVINTTGINTIQEEKNSVTIYPNPSKDIITITAMKLMKSLEVYDMVGQRVLYQVANTNQLTLSLNGLAIGVYNIRINGCIVQKLIKD